MLATRDLLQMGKGFERSNIASMAGYVPGEQLAGTGIIKLNTNESPYPPSPKVQAALAQITAKELRRYPQPTADDFRAAAASVHGVKSDQIIATRGGDELLRLLLTTFVEPGQRVGMTDPTYSLYPVLTAIQDASSVSIPLEDDWSLPADFVQRINAEGCVLTFIVNPHAPTGALLSQDTLEQIAKSLNGMLVVDEAYVDFVDNSEHDLTEWAVNTENVVLLRTLSKGYGLAGLRFGYGIGPADLISPMLYKTRDSYNLDMISQALAEAAIADQAYAKYTWQKVIKQRARLSLALNALGLATPHSEANFLLVTLPQQSKITAESLYLALKQEGILVRYFDHERMHDKLRITVGTDAENTVLLEHLTKLLA